MLRGGLHQDLGICGQSCPKAQPHWKAAKCRTNWEAKVFFHWPVSALPEAPDFTERGVFGAGEPAGEERQKAVVILLLFSG